MPPPIGPRIISIPRVVPIASGGPLSWSGVLKMEKSVDAWYASGGLSRFETPRASVPPSILKKTFGNPTLFKIPVKDISKDATAKGVVYAARTQGPGDHDHFSLFSDKGKLLAVRQKSGDYPQGFFWSNYQTRTVR
jgi:hypothetical protein